MAVQIIGAGFGRTGTWSTFAALNQLGFRCYHMQEVVLNKANKRHLDFWRAVANTRRERAMTGIGSLPITPPRLTTRRAASGRSYWSNIRTPRFS